jgi:hypothetical protein
VQHLVRCKGATCEVKLKGPSGKQLGTVVLALPGGRRVARLVFDIANCSGIMYDLYV